VNPNAPPAAPDPIELVPRPAKPEPKPAESNAVPAEAAAPPAESNAVPAVAAAPPAESNAAPVEAEIELVELPPGPVAPIVHPLAEGLTMEVREWAGERLDSWAEAVAGLRQSETVIGNAVVPEIMHRGNPFRPNNPRKFAASYRGYLTITNAGPYRFLPNADDAAFLFIDGFKVFERPGGQLKLSGKIPVGAGGGLIELSNGVHYVEVHHVMGNAPRGEGTCTFGWVPPGQKRWAVVPRSAFAPAAWAVTGPPQEAAGAAACSFVWGIDEPLVVSGLSLFLVRFEATGKVANPGALIWDMGDGTTRKGRSFRHTYLNPGEYIVTLKSGGGLPLATRRV